MSCLARFCENINKVALAGEEVVQVRTPRYIQNASFRSPTKQFAGASEKNKWLYALRSFAA